VSEPENSLHYVVDALPDEAAVAPALPLRERVQDFLAKDTTGGLLLVFAAVCALIAANSPIRHLYQTVSETAIGPAAWHLNLTVAEWSADGLLALFFLAVGLELKHEITVGSLRNPRQAGVPILAAMGGMAMPALIFALVVSLVGHGYGLGGWAIPTATDIAFALAVLGLFGARMPRGVRTFLLTLAVVDDLLAIIVIAAFYSHHLNFGWLAASLAMVALVGVYARTYRPTAFVMVPLALLAWTFMHLSGVHATISGVLLGLVVPAKLVHDDIHPRTHYWGARIAPWSSALALPVFAFFAAGVDLVDGRGFAQVVNQPVVLAIVAALIVGKFVGVVGTAVFLTRRLGMHLAPGVRLRDLISVGFLAGIGFTVALLVAELSYGAGGTMTDGAKVAILAGSGLSAIAGAIAIRLALRRRDALTAREIRLEYHLPLKPETRQHHEWLVAADPIDLTAPPTDDDSGAFGDHPNF
jgi:Na+:H+ antiporter, NhaA family